MYYIYVKCEYLSCMLSEITYLIILNFFKKNKVYRKPRFKPIYDSIS